VGLVLVAVLTVPSQGILGVAYARGTMLVISAALTAYFVWRSGRLVLDGGAYLRSLASSAIMAVVVFAILTLAGEAGLGRLGLVLASLVMIPVGFGIYLVGMKLLRAYSEEDMDFLETLLPRWLGALARVARKLL
jgi:hypothetical protein